MFLSDATAETGQIELAEQYARDSLGTFRDFADLNSEVLVLRMLGRILLKGGDRSGARECWAGALEILERMDDPCVDEVNRQLLSL